MKVKQQYKDDFATIYEMIDGNRNHLEPFWRIFFIYGIVNLGFWIMQFVGGWVIMRNVIQGSVILNVSELLTILIMGAVILRNYQKNSRNTNRYYQMILLVYGVFIAFIPLVFKLVSMTRALEINTLSFNAQNNISMTMVQLETFAGIFLFMFSLILVGYISKKKIWLALAILHIAIYLFLYVTCRRSFIWDILDRISRTILYIDTDFWIYYPRNICKKSVQKWGTIGGRIRSARSALLQTAINSDQLSCITEYVFFRTKRENESNRWKSKYSIEEIKRMGLYKSTEDVKRIIRR